MTRKIITPSTFKNICQGLASFKPKRQHIMLRRMRALYRMRELGCLRKILEQHLLPRRHQITKAVKWQLAPGGGKYVQAEADDGPDCDVYCGLALTLLK